MAQSKNLLNLELNLFETQFSKNFYRRMLMLIAMCRFQWKNLPNKIDANFLEKTLMTNGEVAIINHEKFGLMAVQCIGQDINCYDRYTKYFCFTNNGLVNEYYNADDIVVIRNNPISEPTQDFINQYAERLSEYTCAKEVNINAIKTPVLIQCSEEQKLTMENAYKQFSGNKPVIFTTKNMDLKDIQIYNTGAEYLADKLQQTKVDELNECLQFLGINTSAIMKKERVTVDEVNSNNGLTNICLSIFLNSRLEGIEETNQKFGCDIGMELSEFCKEDFEPIEEMGVEENE